MPLVLWLVGCAPDLVQDTAAPTYAQDIAPLLDAQCVRCHERGGRMDGGVELDSYEGARATRVRSTCVSVAPDVIDAYGHVLVSAAAEPGEAPCARWDALSMPPGASFRLTRSEQILLARWVEAGAP